LHHYDYAITTKSYELNNFYNYLPKSIYITQGIDKSLHQPQVSFKNKKNGVLFIGHYEKERAIIIQNLITNNIHVTLAGSKWNSFAKQNKNNKHLTCLGKGIYCRSYVKTIFNSQKSLFALLTK